MDFKTSRRDEKGESGMGFDSLFMMTVGKDGFRWKTRKLNDSLCPKPVALGRESCERVGDSTHDPVEFRFSKLLKGKRK